MVDPFERMVQALGRLPGVGEKSATRLAFFILKQGPEYAQELASAVTDAADRMGLCQRCMNLTQAELCSICNDPRRDPAVMCIVASVQDLRAIERCNDFRGTYHVLHGLLAPLDGVGPDELKVRELMERLRESAPKELILATQPTVEGEATALYLQRLVAPLGLTVSRIASGLPMGGDFEYADPATISRALAGRQPM